MRFDQAGVALLLLDAPGLARPSQSLYLRRANRLQQSTPPGGHGLHDPCQPCPAPPHPDPTRQGRCVPLYTVYLRARVASRTRQWQYRARREI